MSAAQPRLVRGDLDGFFGLAIDNLVQFLVILSLCGGVLGFSTELILGRVLPGAAVSVLLGNLFYAWQAQRLSAATGRRDVTALPYGINTVSLFAYVFLIMLPVKLAAQADGANPARAAELAWQVGLAACFVSGLFELGGSLVAERVRRATPRPALLATLAGIAISFIAIDFAMQTFALPLVAMLPLALILTTYFAGIRMPLGIPGGAWALGVGAAAAWLIYLRDPAGAPVSAGEVAAQAATVGWYWPVPVVGDLWAGLTHPQALAYLVPVMVPMGLFNILGSLQNIESAEAAGDPYATRPALAVNGAGSVAASLFGSVFPTTIYIGHPGWKGLGARSGYSVLNGIFFTVLAVGGLIALVDAVVPMEAGMAIVLWIGVVITGQAFQASDDRHASAVAVGLFPAIAGWGATVVTQTLGAAATVTEQRGLPGEVLGSAGAFEQAGLHLGGLEALSQGFMLTCVIWTAISAHLIDRQFRRAAIWAGVGALLAFFGFIHAGHLGPAGPEYTIAPGAGLEWAVGYGLCAGAFLLLRRHARSKTSGFESGPPTG
jgi:AGZA family xanthine/uracil permease-like MFS transporter